MKSFSHINAKSIKEALKLLNDLNKKKIQYSMGYGTGEVEFKDYSGKAKVIAGGTDLLGVLKDRLLPQYPELIINIKTIPGLDFVQEDTEGLKIGALNKLVDITKSSLVQRRYKALAEAAKAVGSPHIRNMGTIGGNLCQDVRCWYYRYPHQVGGRMVCLRKGGNECFAESGDNRYHAIMGGEGCYAVCPSDTAIALTALDAKAKIAGAKGFRTVPIGSFFEPFWNILEPDEIVTEIQVPRPSEGARQAFLKFRLRKAIDFAIVSVATVINVENGVCKDARIVLGAVAPAPVRAREAEETIKGKALDEKVAEATAEAAVLAADPLDMNAYKVEIAKTLVKRSILLQNQ